MIITGIYLFLLVLISFITMVVYGVDKRKAVRNDRRIPEKTLFALSFLGGAIGSLFGMVLFAHKTKHWYFWALNIIFLIIQAIILVVIVLIELKVIVF